MASYQYTSRHNTPQINVSMNFSSHRFLSPKLVDHNSVLIFASLLSKRPCHPGSFASKRAHENPHVKSFSFHKDPQSNKLMCIKAGSPYCIIHVMVFVRDCKRLQLLMLLCHLISRSIDGIRVLYSRSMSKSGTHMAFSTLGTHLRTYLSMCTFM